MLVQAQDELMRQELRNVKQTPSSVTTLSSDEVLTDLTNEARAQIPLFPSS